MSAFAERVAKFQRILAEGQIDFRGLQDLCFAGIPDEKSLRPLCWRLLLSLLPPERAQWEASLKRSRDLYYGFIDEMVVDEPHETQENDHPLSVDPDSKWKLFFKDNEVLIQIDRDVRRTLPDMAFFQQRVSYSNPHEEVRHAGPNILSKRLSAKGVKLDLPDLPGDAAAPRGSQQDFHWQVIERILFIYAKLNPGVGYVQGMNDILGPLYFVFAHDPDPEWRKYAEADSFFCFMALMAEIRDNFVKSLDDASTGIKATMSEVNMKLRRLDLELWKNLTEKDLHPQFYSFRWLTLLLSQEFKLPEVIRLWDTFFADRSRFHFLATFCCAMIINIREELLKADFAESLSLLQNYPSSDIGDILSLAVILDKRSREHQPPE